VTADDAPFAPGQALPSRTTATRAPSRMLTVSTGTVRRGDENECARPGGVPVTTKA
jgi:hypothetical protein